jgi:hypothetical protein
VISDEILWPSSFACAMLSILCVIVILAVGYAYFREGLLTAVTMLVNVFLSGLVAFNFFEPLAASLESTFDGSFLSGFEDALALFVLFAGCLGLLRLATHSLATTELGLPPLVQQVGAVLVGLLTGYLVAGFLVCMLQTLPWGEKFLGFDYEATQGSQGMRRVMPPDRVWLALMHRAGQGPLADDPANVFDPEGSYQLRYTRLRRVKE